MNFKLSDDGREPSSSSADQDQNKNKNDDNTTTTDGQSSSTISTSTTQQQKLQQPKVPISVLPQEVVDQIAAGEVVQRPASVVKELLENCLDAGSTHIIIHVERGGLQKLVVTDNGCGITKSDLALAATRHATSKLSTIQDFKTLQTFGFRGEALASMSMVSKLTITSRTTDSNVGYTQSYKNGTPISNTTTTITSSKSKSSKAIQPKPCARKVGTTITIQDLFYNVPHRRNTYSKRESDEYNRILQVVQYYAIHYAHQAAFCCERVRFTGGGGGGGKSSKTVLVDLNTSQLSHVKHILNNNNNKNTATTIILRQDQIHTVKKQVIAHVFDTNAEQHLSYLECTQKQQESSSSSSSSEIQKEGGGGGANKELEFQVTCKAYYSSPSYESCKSSSSSTTATKFVIFLNHRLVEIPILKRTIEDVYGEFTTKSKKPIVVLDIEVPGAQVDVNVHPSKKQVALMYQDEILTLIGTKLRETLQGHGQSFQIQSVAPTTTKNNNSNKKKKTIQNPYTTTTTTSNNNNRKKSSSTEEDDDPEITTTTPEKTTNQSSKKRKSAVVGGDDSSKSSSSSSKKKKKTPPSQLVRTSNATPVGAIEPFLVHMPKPSQLSQQQQQLSQQQSMTQSSTEEEEEALSPSPSTTNTNDETVDRLTPSPSSSVSSSKRQQQHKTGCPLANVDLSQPGVFASISKCLCNQILLKPPISIMRPKKVIPTKCSYTSVASLRKRVNKHLSDTMAKQIREGYFVGVVSYQRSLIQCGEELVLINHFELAKVLFYQLALARFGGAKMAHLSRSSPSTAAGGEGEGEGHDPAMQGLNIHTLISQALQLEDTMVSMTNDGSTTNSDNRNCDLLEEQPPASSCPDFDLDEDGLLPVNNTNRQLAADATACLLENAEMLKDYFSIRIEKSKQSSSRINNSTCKNQDGNAEDGGDAGRGGDDDRNRAILTGLPVLLDGHMPQSHGLGIFLLRLATQVNWREERPCFQGICKEIGNFYAMLPPCERNVDDELISYIRHTLFPALSYLLLPSERLSNQGYFTVMTKLSTLYKVFERC